MQQRPLGRSGLAVSRLALGTMTWGRDTDADDAAAQLKTFRDAGGTLLDTADVYTDGEAESVIGALVGRLMVKKTKRFLDMEAQGLKARSEQLSRANGAHS